MAVAFSPPAHAFPPELVRAVAQDAARDADHVGGFLSALGLNPPRRLPADFLLGVGAALRLLRWEHRVHLDAGLPPARQALHEVFRTATGQAQPDEAHRAQSLAGRVTALFVEHFAWVGRVELDADIVLGQADPEDLLEVLADFLWACRRP